MDAEPSLLVEKVKIGCTLGMLQCLDRPHRLAYVLGEILDMSGPEGAEALEITREVFRSGVTLTLIRGSGRTTTAPSMAAIARGRGIVLG